MIAQIICLHLFPPSKTDHIELWYTSVAWRVSYISIVELLKIYGHRCLSPNVDFTLGIEDSYKYMVHLFSCKHICILFFSKSGDRQYVALFKDLGPGKLERYYLRCGSRHLCSKTRHVVFYPHQQFHSL